MMKSKLKNVATAILIALTGLSWTISVQAAEKIEEAVLGMNVSGTKDLPNVLYIIPWKSNATQVSPPEITRLVDEIYAPVDPEVFAKQVKFYYQLTAAKDASAPIEKAGQ